MNYLYTGKNVKLMVFDLDGTLIDSISDLAGAVNHTMSELSLPCLPQERIRSYIGDGFTQLLTRALGPHHTDKLDQALAIINPYYGRHLLDNTILYPGIEDVLQHFSHLPKVVVTQKTIAYTKVILESLNIANHFVLVLGIDSTPYKKPDQRIITFITGQYTCINQEIVVIGDGVNDILLAKNSGALSCAFLNGITHRDTLLTHNPDLTYEKPSELISLLS